VRWGSKANLGRRLDPSKRSLDERSDIRVWFFAARMRPGTSLGEGVRIGNFVETTAAVVEVGVKVKDVPDDAMAWSAARRITAMVGRSDIAR
jgi:hypothetical protein